MIEKVIGYSVAESLSVGTPVIITDVKAYKEIGVKNNENGFILDLNLNKVNYIEIYKKSLKFNFQPKEDHYNDILSPGKNTYKFIDDDLFILEAIKNFSLKEFDKIKIIKRAGGDIYGKLKIGDIFGSDINIANYLTGDNPDNKVVAKIIKI